MMANNVCVLLRVCDLWMQIMADYSFNELMDMVLEYSEASKTDALVCQLYHENNPETAVNMNGLWGNNKKNYISSTVSCYFNIACTIGLLRSPMSSAEVLSSVVDIWLEIVIITLWLDYTFFHPALMVQCIWISARRLAWIHGGLNPALL